MTKITLVCDVCKSAEVSIPADSIYEYENPTYPAPWKKLVQHKPSYKTKTWCGSCDPREKKTAPTCGAPHPGTVVEAQCELAAHHQGQHAVYSRYSFCLHW